MDLMLNIGQKFENVSVWLGSLTSSDSLTLGAGSSYSSCSSDSIDLGGVGLLDLAFFGTLGAKCSEISLTDCSSSEMMGALGFFLLVLARLTELSMSIEVSLCMDTFVAESSLFFD